MGLVYSEISADSESKRYYDTRGLADKYTVVKAADSLFDFVDIIGDFMEEEIQNAKTLGQAARGESVALATFQAKVSTFATRFDPELKRLRNMVQSCVGSRAVIDKYESTAKSRTDSTTSFPQRMRKLDAQRKVSEAQRIYRGQGKNAESLSKTIINELEKLNLKKRVDSILEKMGLAGEIKIERLKKLKIPSGTIKVGVGTYFKVWTFKDIIVDLVSYKEWGTEVWKQRIIHHIYDLLDGLVIGYASTVLAQMIVLAGAGLFAAAGVSISAGVIAIIVATVAVLIGMVIGYLLSEADVSFTEYAVEGYKTIMDCAFR